MRNIFIHFLYLYFHSILLTFSFITILYLVLTSIHITLSIVYYRFIITMPTQEGKLYRSNINYKPVTNNPYKQSHIGSDYINQTNTHKDTYKRSTLQHTSSHANLKTRPLNQSRQIIKQPRQLNKQTRQITKQTIPCINIRQIQNTSFMSIDDTYLNPKFNKKKQSLYLNKILPNHINDQHFDTQSIGARSIKTHQGQDQYYKYWKTKAHQYLQQNFKLRQQNKLLKNSLQTIQKNNLKQNKQQKVNSKEQQTKVKEQKSFLYLQNIFKKKLNQLQNQLKEKNVKIVHLQDKILELNKKILGEEERIQLIERLGTQIDTLTQQNILLKKQIILIQNKTNYANDKIKQQQLAQTQTNSPIKPRYRSKDKYYTTHRKPSQQNYPISADLFNKQFKESHI